MDNKKITHGEIVEIGAKYLLRKSYKIVLTEMSVCNKCGEILDILGFNYNNSILIEVKTSVSDLKKDKEKVSRYLSYKYGVGEYKYFLYPEKIYEKALKYTPKEWGIFTINKNKVIRKKRGSKCFVVDWTEERHYLLSALRRLKIEETNIVKIKKIPTNAKRRNIFLNENTKLEFDNERN